MTTNRRWQNCVQHRSKEVQEFISQYLGDGKRQVLLIAGAGFDPRSTTVLRLVAATLGSRASGLFLREERPNPAKELVDRAAKNLDRMIQSMPSHKAVQLKIFADDGAVIGGREAIQTLAQLSLTGVTDVLIDFSALSRGVAFPIVRYLLERAQNSVPSFNLHLMVSDEPEIDSEVVSIACDKVSTIHGFKGSFGLDDTNRAAKLWLPQYARGQHAILDRIYNFVQPHDVCPILPFPSSNPRAGDELIEHYGQEFESVWEVDARNIVYADEKSPLDLYRTILRIDDARKRVFAEVGGSLLVLTPIGSKAMAIGALMAAIERDFPVAYIESIGYTVNFQKVDEHRMENGELVHVWLHGEAYQN
jgi:hypothetical protein